MPKTRLSVQEKAPDYSKSSPYSGDIELDAFDYEQPEFEELERRKSLIWPCYLGSSLGEVKCDCPKNLAGLYGFDAIERLGLQRKKYALHVSRAGYLLKAEGFDDNREFEEAMKRIQRPSRIVWEPRRKPGLDDYKTARFEILLKLDFPREYLWTAKVKSMKEFNKRWSGEVRKSLPVDSPAKPYVLFLNNGDALLKASGFSSPLEFLKACEELAGYAKISFPCCPQSEIDDLSIDLSREWIHLPDKISGEAFFSGVAYLGEKVRETLYPEEILYIILKVQQRVQSCGAVEAVQRFRSEDGVSVICSDTMRGRADGWQMTVSRF